MAVPDDSERAPDTISKAMWATRETRYKLPETSPSEVKQDVFKSPNREWCDNPCEMLPAQKLVEASAHGLLPGAAHQAPWALTYSNCRLQSGGQGFASTVWAHGATHHSGSSANSRFPEAGQRPAPQAGLSKENSQACQVSPCPHKRRKQGVSPQLGRPDPLCQSKHQRACLLLSTSITSKGHFLRSQNGLCRPREDTTGKN